jgi:ABC-type nitrate/sulfonate/bicarbonate transport system substrate-binding protein
MVKKKSAASIIGILMLVIAGTVVWHVYHSGQKQVKIVGSITLGFTEGEAASAIYVADKLNFFAAKGLKVTLRPFGLGMASYQAMLKGEVDIGGPTEYVIVGAAFRNEKVNIVSSIVKADLISIIGRKDHGIKKVSDLDGKRIGLPRNTIAEFYLGRFLELHGLSIDDVAMVDMNPSQAVGSIREGAVDAVVTYPPFYDSIKSALGAGIAEWPAQSGQMLYGVLTCRKDWIDRNPDLLVRVLKALEQAHLYMAQHPKEAKSIVQKRLKVDAGTVDRIWQQNVFSLTLDQSLITAMEDEARWMISKGLTREKQNPDFLNYVYIDGLKTVKPEAVSIIR